ncbi:short-chain dehydrogenase [Gordonia spumicola]|uniref:Short-chain dehydrogenase n=1 Tax=Gordonia spumicola TaxID=589161 RepID=A0A7I9VET4_9ACTN|nr:short-chain dehydrogenase [Gordonia spumicola]
MTGAASGIGRGIARALVTAGANVALADIDEGRLADVAGELTDAGGVVSTVVLDVSDPDAWATAADRVEKELGEVSILCSIAGVVGTPGPIERTPFAVWRWVQSINVDAQFLAISTFVPRFKLRGTRAHVLNCSSMAGLTPMGFVGSYAASKFASVGLSLSLREELRDTAIDVSLLVPGTVATDITRTAAAGEAKLLGRDAETTVAEANAAIAAAGADPDLVGVQVVEAMQARQFLIPTHPEFGVPVAALHAEIVAAFDGLDGRHGPDPAAAAFADGGNPIVSADLVNAGVTND